MIGNYKILEKIGKGTFGIVYKAKRINESLIYVIKQISLSGLTDFQIKQVKSEAKILSLINSKYVVKYYESFLENDDLNIVMEYCDNGDLCNYISKQKKPLKEDLIWQMFIKITLGLIAIHKMKILHRDIKTLNIFLNKNMEIKIGDLGVAKQLNQASFANTIIGTPYYLSPEMCEDKPYNQKSDVWALGCILYELCTYRHPFDASNHGALILKILKAEPDPILAIYSSKLQKLVKQILEKDCEKRPNCWDILNNPDVVEKAQKLGLYQEIMNALSPDNNNHIVENAIRNTYTYNINNYGPFDSEDILLKSQLTAPNNNGNKIHVKKLNREERRVLKVNNNNRRSCASVDRNLKNVNENHNNYLNNINIVGLDNNQNNIQYANLDNLYLANNMAFDNDYLNNNIYNTNVNNNYELLNGNYYSNNNNNYNNIYNNDIDINSNNLVIYNPVLVDENNIINNNPLPYISPDIGNEAVKCAKVTRLYKDNEETQNQIINNQNNNNEIRYISNINDSINSLSISIQPPSIDMDRMNNNKNEIISSSIISKKDNVDNYYRYPFNSISPSDNRIAEYPSDNIQFANNNNNNIPLTIVNNENIEVKPIIKNETIIINKDETRNENLNINNIKNNNTSSTKNTTLINQPVSEISFISKHPKEKSSGDIMELNSKNKDRDKYKDIFVDNSNYNNIIEKKSEYKPRKKTLKENNCNSYKKFFEGNNNFNNKDKNEILNIDNYLFKKKNKENNKKILFDDINDNDYSKLNKTSINLSSSDNFNINIDHQDPIPVENQLKENNNINNINLEESDFNLLKNNDDDNILKIDEIKKDEQEIPKINEDIDIDQQEEKDIKIKKKLKEKNNSSEINFRKTKNDNKFLFEEKDFNDIMEYPKEKDKDKAYNKIEKYRNNNNNNLKNKKK